MYKKRDNNAVYEKVRGPYSCAADIVHWQVYDLELEVFIRQTKKVEFKKKRQTRLIFRKGRRYCCFKVVLHFRSITMNNLPGTVN